MAFDSHVLTIHISTHPSTYLKQQPSSTAKFAIMSPSLNVPLASPDPNVGEIKSAIQNASSPIPIREPLKYSGSLDDYKSFDVTPVIGRELPDVQLVDILNDDQKIRDLAITGM